MKHLKYLILALGLSVCEPLMAQGGLFSLVKKVGTMIDVCGQAIGATASATR